MREIKFRAWNDIDKMMVDWSLLKCQPVFLSSIINNKLRHYKIMQYTGLKDAKGVEIYEGDVVSSYHFTDSRGDHFINHIIKWSERFNGWFALNEESKSEDDGSVQLWVYLRSNKHTIKVIGNIHQNPELLD